MMKTTLVLFTCLFAAATSGLHAQYGGGSGTQADPYQITTVAHLANLATNVNNGHTYKDTVFILTQDLDLNHQEWTPIGKYTGFTTIDKPFSGSFDGNGKTIQNLKVSGNYQAAGLFCYIYAGTNGFIKNLHLAGTDTITTSFTGGYTYVGALAGRIYVPSGCQYLIDSCTNNLPVKGYAASGSYSYTGGICGYISGFGTLTLKSCLNSGNVTGGSGGSYSYTGGIYGNVINYSLSMLTLNSCLNSGNVTGGGTLYSYTGGICGYGYNEGGTLTLNLCFNSGTIMDDRTSRSYTGGIYGSVYNYIDGTLTLHSCLNSGNITGGGASSSHTGYTGGICGYVDNSGTTMTLNACLSSGNITGGGASSSYTGGICGNVYNYGTTLTLNSCLNSGNVTGGGGSNSFTGGIMGYTFNQSLLFDIKQCYSYANIAAANGKIGGITGMAKTFTTSAKIFIDSCYYLQEGNINKGINAVDSISQYAGSTLTVGSKTKAMNMTDFGTAGNFAGWGMQYLPNGIDNSRPFPTALVNNPFVLAINISQPPMQEFTGSRFIVPASCFSLQNAPANVSLNSADIVTMDTLSALGTALLRVEGFALSGSQVHKYVLLNVPATVQAGFGYKMSAKANAGGSISPAGDTVVLGGSTLAYTITLNSGYRLDSVWVNGISTPPAVSGMGYTFINISKNNSIEAYFAANVTGITLDRETLKMAPESEATLVATVLPANAANKGVVWTSSVPGVAVVTQTGKVVSTSTKGVTIIKAATAEGGFFAECVVTVTDNTGIAETQAAESTFKIYPNPTNGELRIESGELRMEEIQLLDVAGKRVFETKKTDFNISHLPTGIYFMRLKTDKGNITKKVIKQ